MAPHTQLCGKCRGSESALTVEAKEAQARLGELTRLEFSPIIPIERPPTAKERNDFAREIARWFVNNRSHVMEGAA